MPLNGLVVAMLTSWSSSSLQHRSPISCRARRGLSHRSGEKVVVRGGARWNRTTDLSIIRETVTPLMTGHDAEIYLLSRRFVVLRSASEGLARHHSCRPSRRNRGAALPVPTTDLSLSDSVVATRAGDCPGGRGPGGTAATLRVIHGKAANDRSTNCILDCVTTPVPTRFSDEEIELLDELVAAGIGETRSAVVREAVVRLADTVRRAEDGCAIATSYRESPQSADEDQLALANALAMTEAEPW